MCVCVCVCVCVSVCVTDCLFQRTDSFLSKSQNGVVSVARCISVSVTECVLSSYAFDGGCGLGYEATALTEPSSTGDTE